MRRAADMSVVAGADRNGREGAQKKGVKRWHVNEGGFFPPIAAGAPGSVA